MCAMSDGETVVLWDSCSVVNTTPFLDDLTDIRPSNKVLSTGNGTMKVNQCGIWKFGVRTMSGKIVHLELLTHHLPNTVKRILSKSYFEQQLGHIYDSLRKRLLLRGGNDAIYIQNGSVDTMKIVLNNNHLNVATNADDAGTPADSFGRVGEVDSYEELDDYPKQLLNKPSRLGNKLQKFGNRQTSGKAQRLTKAKVPVQQSEAILAHLRFGHLSPQLLKKAEEYLGLDLDPNHDSFNCKPCELGKRVRQFFRPLNMADRTRCCGELVFTDIHGPFREPGIENKERYLVLFIDAYSRFPVLYAMKTKDEFLEKLMEYRLYCKSLGIHLTGVRADNDSVITCKKTQDWAMDNGINFTYTAAYSHESNGIAERHWRTIMTMALCFLMTSGLPVKFWVLAAMHANYIRARLPHPGIKDRIPSQL